MLGEAVQLQADSQRTPLSRMEVCRDGRVVGYIVRDPSGRFYRYFPGIDNELAFVFESRTLRGILRAIETRSWESELKGNSAPRSGDLA